MLCTQDDVEQRLQINFTATPDPVCAALIAAAQGHIEREVGRPVEDDNYTELFNGTASAYLFLANTPINSVASVTVDGDLLTVATDYLWKTSGKVSRVANGYLTSWDTYKPGIVSIVYNGGWVTPPADLVDVCAWAAARAFKEGAAFAAMPAAGGSGAVQSVTLADSDSVTFSDSVTGGLATLADTRPVSLTPEEIAICRSYRRLTFGFA